MFSTISGHVAAVVVGRCQTKLKDAADWLVDCCFTLFGGVQCKGPLSCDVCTLM